MKMKNIIYLLSLVVLSVYISCNESAELNEDFFGHYVTTEYIDAFKKDKNYINNSLHMKELVFF